MTDIIVTKATPVISYTQEQINTIRNTIAKEATNDELSLFLNQCKRTGLDPFARQIYFIKNARDGKVQIQVSIDGFRAIAQRSGEYEGQTPAQWCGKDGVWKEVWNTTENPVASRVGVYRKGFREPLYAVAHWAEYYGQPGYMQKKMGAHMLAKVAESLALRKAFPNEMGGLYTREEMVAEDEPIKKEVKNVEVVSATLPPVAKITSQPEPISYQQSAPDFQDAYEEYAKSAPEQEAAPVAITRDQIAAYRVPFGKKHKGKSLEEMGEDAASGYAQWLQTEADKSGKPLDGQALEFYKMVEAFIQMNRGII